MLKVSEHVASAVVMLTCMASVAIAQDIADLAAWPEYETPVPYSGERNFHVTQNLGPTGARCWVMGNRGNSTASRELLIKSVEPGSPADGILRPYDIIVGAAIPPDAPSTEWTEAPVKRFDSDARLAFARAITWAESDAGRGKLVVIRDRNGKVEQATITLPVMGTYSATAPYNCPKTTKIVENAAAFVAQHMPANGYTGLQGAHHAMLMYASGDDRYLDHVRRSALAMAAGEVSDAGHETWRWGNVNTFLCEYYLATGDKRVLKKIKGYSDALAAGQCNPGTWGHRAVPDFIPPGYGSLNSSGTVCFLSLILARQAGVAFDEQALINSINFYGSYAGRGSIPYGDHPPGSGPTANGKNGMAAVAFHQLHADPAAQWFARLCASSNLIGFEGGHTGNFFNQTWGPLGASLAGRENYQQFWARFNPYRDMCRRRDGGFVAQPWPHTREGDLGTGNYVRKGPMWSTGGYALSYLAGTNRLAILGRRTSVFGANPPAELKPALELYHAKKFAEAADAAGRVALIDDLHLSTLATQLQDASQRNINSLALTLADMKRNLELGDLLTLSAQLNAIESIIDADDDRLAEFRAAVDAADESQMHMLSEFDRLNRGVQWAGPLGFEMFARPIQTRADSRAAAKKLAASELGMAKFAKAMLDDYPMITLFPDKALYENKPGDDWKMSTSQEEGWTDAEFLDLDWQPFKLTPQSASKTHYLRRVFTVADPSAIEALGVSMTNKADVIVYINGEKVLNFKGVGWGTRTQVPLMGNTMKLLKAGENVVAVTLKPNGNPTFDLTLMATMKP